MAQNEGTGLHCDESGEDSSSHSTNSLNEVYDDSLIDEETDDASIDDCDMLEISNYYTNGGSPYIPGRPGRKPQNEINKIGSDIISDETLCITPVKQLNHLLKTYKCSKDQIQKLKHRRRILRNRGYTLKCRDRKLSQQNELSEECVKFKNAFDQKNHENEQNIAEIKRLAKEV